MDRVIREELAGPAAENRPSPGERKSKTRREEQGEKIRSLGGLRHVPQAQLKPTLPRLVLRGHWDTRDERKEKIRSSVWARPRKEEERSGAQRLVRESDSQ